MTVVVLACSDLMTASMFGGEGIELRRCSTADAALERLAAEPQAVCVVDLTAFEALPLAIRERGLSNRIVAFAPHVREDLLDAARATADEVVPRGAAIKQFARLVSV